VQTSARLGGEFASADLGASWQLVADLLLPFFSVYVATPA